jgi:hypothetical protein
VEVACVQDSSASFKATATGLVRAKLRDARGDYALEGELDVTIQAWDQPTHSEHLMVRGSSPSMQSGLHAGLEVINATADGYQNVFIRAGDDALSSDRSTLSARDPRPNALDPIAGYSMSCSASRVRLPPITDLRLDRTWSYSLVPPEPGSLFLNNALLVENIGNQTLSPRPIRVRVDGREVAGQLHPLSTGDSSIPPGFSGFIQLDLPFGSIARCATFEVELDLDKTVQQGQWSSPSAIPAGFSPYGNDREQAKSPCLTWTTPIDYYTLGTRVGSGLISNVTLQEIVSSEVVARESDHQLCSFCHHANEQNVRYFAADGLIEATQSLPGKQVIGAGTEVDVSWTWAQNGGWAERFLLQDGEPGEQNKPEYLKAVFRRWLQDGAR